jgi:hypothetical protein
MLLYKGSKPNLRMFSGFQFFCRLMCCFDGILTDRNKKCFMMVDLYNDSCTRQGLNFIPNSQEFPCRRSIDTEIRPPTRNFPIYENENFVYQCISIGNPTGKLL